MVHTRSSGKISDTAVPAPESSNPPESEYVEDDFDDLEEMFDNFRKPCECASQRRCQCTCVRHV